VGASAATPAAGIAIVMPALNEEAAVGAQVRALWAHPAIRALPVARIIVVDNGSDDATARVAREAGAEVMREARRGYGYACLAGVRAADGCDVVLLMDADGSDDPGGAARVARLALRGEADLAVGSRTRGRRERGALTLQQHVGNAVAALGLRLIYGARVTDIGPVRAIRRETLLGLDMREMAFGWSTEMLAKAARAGLVIRETPVDYRRRAGGKSKVAGTLRGTLRASVHILRTLARYARWQPSVPVTPAIRRLRQRPARSALFIVARLPIAGLTKTRLGAAIGHEAAATLYGAFLCDLGRRFGAAAARDGYDLYWYYAAPEGYDDEDFAAYVPAGSRLLRQPEGDFGARLWHGFTALADLGYTRIVVLGSDSPQVPDAWVHEALAMLVTHDVAIGPACDGGYYLLGQRADPAPADLFIGIQMSTAEVYAQTLARADAAGLRVATLPPTFDVDEAGDLARLRVALERAPSDDAAPAPATLAALGGLQLREQTLAAAGIHGPEGAARAQE
jgi:rSAM/selenodomain-associated transferase 1